jgi:O-antigen ligase
MAAASLLFAAACLHATFLMPYVILVPGERTNVFTALALCLPALWLAPRARRIALRKKSLLAWGMLGAGLCVSSLTSATPLPSTLRALAFYLPAVSGLACARLLLDTAHARWMLFRLLTFCFGGLALSHLIFGTDPSFMGLHHHALAGMLVLLSAGPVKMALDEGGWRRVLAVGLLLAGLAVCFLAGSRFVVLLPFVLIPLMALLHNIRLRYSLAGILLSLGLAAVFFTYYPAKVMHLVSYESTFYRIGGAPAALEVTRQAPWLGIGLRTPRRGYLENFTPPFGTATREEFLRVVDTNVTWDNQYLSMLCGVGAPLTLLYLWLAGGMLLGFVKRARGSVRDRGAQAALTFALLATFIHLFVHDGLLYPQIDWLFHVLLGVGWFTYGRPEPDAPPAA